MGETAGALRVLFAGLAVFMAISYAIIGLIALPIWLFR
jgi:hypothetical protein